ncbi:MAG: endonuclease domain-containing protein [Caulobacteraceae bacterium]
MKRPPPDRETLLVRARQMRSAPTQTEAVLWSLLRGRQVGGLKFRRQFPLGPYIADFACLWPKLIVEADGEAHRDPAYDAERDAWMAAQGYTVLRFPNDQVLSWPREVERAILKAAGL